MLPAVDKNYLLFGMIQYIALTDIQQLFIYSCIICMLF